MKKICCIYIITSPSNKVYIGQTINFKRRLREYKSGKYKSQTALFNSIKKYGFESHKIEIIEECLSDSLNYLETYYIKKYNSCYAGLNCNFGGDVKELTMETKKKISKSLTGMFAGEKHPMYGKKHTEESNQKRSDTMKGVDHSYKKCIKLSDDVKDKIGLSCRKYYDVFNSNGNLLGRFHGAKKTAEFLGTTRDYVSKIIREKGGRFKEFSIIIHIP
jgi:group I intron endonuclease